MKILENTDFEKIKTEFASPERATYDELFEQKILFSDQHLLIQFLNSIPVHVTVLNSHRQIVFANQSFQEFLSLPFSEILGKRPGEAVDCINWKKGISGCGTSKFCRQCGAVNAILKSYKGNRGIEECRITLDNSHALDLMVWATPIKIGDHEFTIFTMSDVSHEKRRKALERIFFHDILNTAGAVRGFFELIRNDDPSNLMEYLKITETMTEQLIEEIKAQRTISAAENDELILEIQPFSTREILEEIKMIYSSHQVSHDKNIEIKTGCIDIVIRSDKTILRRIIGNLLKNALEASKAGDTVNLSCRMQEGFVEFMVENPTFIPEEIQTQLFQRSFSTKGIGRGLGTYSVKMLSERYLEGQVKFVSSRDKGTVFTARYPKAINN
ncbi:MAG: GHKL domain-containing protein [Melioribacteraceae bacterium]|nr:GHKL domain-containing protein [Melioribacteraceae bacterium]